MKICLNCGKENENWICDNCKETINIESLCNDINSYNPLEESNKIFDSIIDNIKLYKFKQIVCELAQNLEPFTKSSLIISSLTNNFTFKKIYSTNRELFYSNAQTFLNNPSISQYKKEYILECLFITSFDDFNFEEAEKLANIIQTHKNIDKYTLYELGIYYIYTRRYELAKEFLEKRLKLLDDTDDEKTKKAVHKSYEEIDKRKNGLISEYMPLKPERQEQYCNFMNSLGFDLKRKLEQAPRERNKIPQKIALEDYPNIKENEINDFNFDTFVAFDLETTGFRRKKSTLSKASKIDDIIEIAAIKVINGKIDESATFTFQELVHPLKTSIKKEIEELTGITNQMVYDAEQIYEVFPKFMNFVGDNILVGFNCINFDCDFLMRAGRYSNLIIKNDFFDIYRNLKKLNISPASLGELCEQFNITNDKAHRALSDSIATAKLYLKLKEKIDKSPLLQTPSILNKPQAIKIINGTYQDNDTNLEIWENLIDDCDKNQQSIIKTIIKKYPDNVEKPIYYPTIEFTKNKQRITVNELWQKSKTMLFLPENIDDYTIAKSLGWKCFILDEKFDIEEFIRSVK